MSAGSQLPSTRAFLERTRELAALSSSLQAARARRGTVCVVSGEAGIGKSRLLAEFTADCSRSGISAHWGSAWEAGGAPAYWPWIQILRSLLACPPARDVLHQQARLGATLAQLVPELDMQGSAIATPLEPEQARFRLMDAVASFLQAVASRSPLLLVLEDIHATDVDSLALLEFVATQLRHSQVLLLASYRDSELHRPRIGNVITRIKREAVQLHLSKLGRDAVREYVHVATGSRPLEQTVAEIYALTEGHPLYLKEIVELGIARGGFRAIPTTLTTAIRERVAALPEDTRALLGTASILGREWSTEALAQLADVSLDRVDHELGPAIAVRLIEPTVPGRLRFEHVLVRETLHESLPGSRRRELHSCRARQLQVLDEAQLSWAELAQHFEESGPEWRERAVHAWRRAAAQADARNAFDDAALCSARALETLTRVAAAPVALRARLLLDLAAAQIRAGDLDAGRRNATEAFNLAESSHDAELMADAALIYGGIFTFGNVDHKLVQLLRTAFDALGDGSPGRRARVLARLAAAMQPAADPSEPIALARESIRVARGTGDPRTLLSTLRSAISAMMDLGDPNERIELNREYVALAESLFDASEIMRGYTRMVVDAMELADAATMDRAIEQCDSLATQLVLPRYQWTAAAFRVLQATLRGDVQSATAALEQAERLAQRAQDPNAARTLAVQRAAIAELRGSREEMRQCVDELERSFAGLPMAEMYLKPYILVARIKCGECTTIAAMDEAHVEGVIRFHDLGALCELGEYLAMQGDRKLAERVYQSLLPHRALCGHWGLLGMRWTGPVARVLGLLAQALGDADAAESHFREALTIARRMSSPPWIDRIERSRAPVPLPRPSGEARGLPAMDYFRLRRDGDFWVCECEGASFSLRDTRGLQMLARLIAEPNREFHAIDLVGASMDQAIDAGDSGTLLDERARQAYRRRAEELREAITEAESMNDPAAAATAREELEQLTSELTRAFGLGGRARRAGSAAERARVNAQRRIKDAITRIGKECPAAARHLEWAVRTGVFCSYQPR